MSDIHVDYKAIEFIIRNVQQVSGVLNWGNIMILIYKNIKHNISITLAHIKYGITKSILFVYFIDVEF